MDSEYFDWYIGQIHVSFFYENIKQMQVIYNNEIIKTTKTTIY